MPDPSPPPAGSPEFSRVIELAPLRDRERVDFDIAPDAAETAALARLMGAVTVRKLRFRGQLTALPRGWQLDATLGATVVQPCVVTLEPVTTRIDQAVRRRFLPVQGAAQAEIVLGPDDDDEVEPLGERIDLGLVATEALALALPPYPRKSGATLAAGGLAGRAARAAEEDAVKPFAALAALRDKLGNTS